MTAPNLICGIDEVGRGPIAGPVTAAAVILPAGFPIEILKDSKRLSPAARMRISLTVRQSALECHVGWAWPEEIDRINIHRATLLAMQRAARQIKLDPDLVLIDGLFSPPLPWPVETIVRGDASVPAIQAASIVAKVARDQWMIRYGRIEPLFGFGKHKGYPTREHRRIVMEIGRSPIHRRSFRISAPS